MSVRLVTIPISHYGERARWALDRAGVTYEERHHLQMFSWVAAYRRGGKKTLPIVDTGDGVLTDSAEVVRWAESRSPGCLYPASATDRAEVERLERELVGDFGVEARRIGYDWFLRAPLVSLRYNDGHAPLAERALLRAAMPLASRFLRRYLEVSPSAVARGLDLVNRTFDAIAERLADGRRYLVADRFTAADLAFAAMSAPCLLPSNYGVPLPTPDEIPAAAAARVRAWREHLAGEYVMRVYREDRGGRAG